MEAAQRKPFLTYEFQSRYQTPPTLFVQAPGRVDLMGSHTDYNLGYVLTQAIDRNTWIAGELPSSLGLLHRWVFTFLGCWIRFPSS